MTRAYRNGTGVENLDRMVTRAKVVCIIEYDRF